jgi:hypothetical protein
VVVERPVSKCRREPLAVLLREIAEPGHLRLRETASIESMRGIQPARKGIPAWGLDLVDASFVPAAMGKQIHLGPEQSTALRT